MSTNLKIKISENLGLVPPIIGHLASIPENAFSYRHYHLRHPGGIFNTQFGSATSDLYELVKYINGLNHEELQGGNWNDLELIRKFTLSLFSFSNFINSAYEIILACCRQEATFPDKEIWRWLKENNYSAGQKYYNVLSEIREILDTLNELKHSSTRFGTVSMQRSIDGITILGYYVASVDSTGAIGPNEKYHPRFNGELTGTSFSLRLRTMYYGIYKASDALLTSLKEHFREIYNQELEFDVNRREREETAAKLFTEINSLPLALFPNEKSLSIPVSRKVKRGTEEYLLFEKVKPHIPNSGYKIMSLLPLADGFSRSWNLPYYQRRAR